MLLTVTFIKVTPDGTQISYPGVRALRRVVAGTPQDSLARLQPDMATIHLDAGTLTGVTPDRQDLIVQADGTTWVVHKASLETLATRWRCETQKLLTTS